jgi:23S rRNA maturation mini-RNase III
MSESTWEIGAMTSYDGEVRTFFYFTGNCSPEQLANYVTADIQQRKQARRLETEREYLVRKDQVHAAIGKIKECLDLIDKVKPHSADRN